MTTPAQIAPPPWTLHGEGIVMVAHFSESFVRKHGFLNPTQQKGYRGYVGLVMLVDYRTSGVGPYRELLFIPGLFRLNGQTVFSISKIYVSTYDSVWNGIQNWGIPKELADFELTTRPDGTRHFAVSQQGEPFFSAQVKPWGPRLPVKTRLLPPFRIMQQHDGKTWLLTQPEATGRARLGSLKQVKVNPAYFPDISQGRVLSTFVVDDFEMTFPVPQSTPV
ncbi:hypothetical protein F5984_16925 [Rudanella paleaurantiibacter]|uniref:Acetoacetate decarboxylase n=1 Tax=Rudanella paleaurantiibacter TaxID=2614655 RepID=A0A7J5TXD8_9BACT|nr:acetoacetate decarboxylase family protein [Rudanella paleaurantiibacter]KAB7729312.1 hypothetical protein F5984_16925 [Rudanella paleaurantiibacter]